MRAEFRSPSGIQRTVMVENVSRGGVFIRLADEEPTGAQVELAMALEGERLQLAGEIVRRVGDGQEAGIGIRFTALEDETRRHLANWVLAQYCGDAEPMLRA